MSGLVEVSLPRGAKEFTDGLIDAGGLPVGFAVIGGTARHALVEACGGLWQPPRDVDVIGLADMGADMLYVEQVEKAAGQFGVDESDPPVLVPDLDHWFVSATDYRINAVSIVRTEEGTRIITRETAVDDMRARDLYISEMAAKRAQQLSQSANPTDQKLFDRARTNLPARGAYIKAVIDNLFQADCRLNLGTLALPNRRQVSNFFIGLMLVKALQVDNIANTGIYSRAYMRNIDALGMWDFAKKDYSAAVALRGIMRGCPALQARNINPSVTKAMRTPIFRPKK